MHPVPFDYAAPTRLEEAVALLAGREGAMALAGGQNVMQSASLRELRPALLVDLGRLAELRGLGRAGDVLRIGAGEPMWDVEHHPLVARHAPLLARTLRTVGSVAIRSRATLGGSAAWADPTSQLPATLLALGAAFVVRGPEGERTLPAEGFWRPAGPQPAAGPSGAPLRAHTPLVPGDVIVAVELPLAAHPGGHGLRLVRRTSITWPVAGCAATRRDGEVRLGLFGAGPAPLLARSLAEVPDRLDPPSDARGTAAYRRAVLPVLARRALTDAESGGEG
jgi:carbon-monoxide dehydrogenase medium subunit